MLRVVSLKSKLYDPDLEVIVEARSNNSNAADGIKMVCCVAKVTSRRDLSRYPAVLLIVA